MLYKKTGDILLYGRCIGAKIFCHNLKIWHEKRWFCLKDTYILYQDLNYNISMVMLVDRDFECQLKMKAGAYHAIELKNQERRLELKFKSSHQQKTWYDKIMFMLTTTASGRLFHEPGLLPHGSFAPVRRGQSARWFLNASAYMESVMHALSASREEIYIAGWWLCPELYLKRPTDHIEYRLDKILARKASEGVKIYVLLYKEIKFALNLMSQRTRQILTENGTNRNIRVLRHPDHFSNGVFLWSHHEKIIIIDQTIGFLGGIDLCYGRWDDESHRFLQRALIFVDFRTV
jgi:phospholipase D1/2